MAPDSSANIAPDSGASTPHSRATPASQSLHDESSSISSQSESDAEFEIEQQIAKYVTLKSRLYEINPGLPDLQPRKQKRKVAKTRNANLDQAHDADRKIARLTAKLNKVKSDILFDEDEADRRWADVYFDLAKETAERKRLDVRNDHEQAKPTDPSTGGTAASDETEESGGRDEVLGELFFGLPDVTNDLDIDFSMSYQADVLAKCTVQSLEGSQQYLWRGAQITAQTRLVYATTGIVMRMLERSDDLGDITHLVLDEVHERSIDSDFLLIVLRKLLLRRPGLKVVLMSATVDAQRFSRYLDQAPIFNVPGRTFPVETRYLEDAIETTRFNAKSLSTGVFDDDDDYARDASAKTTLSADNLRHYSPETCNTLLQLDEYRISYELIVRLLEVVATHEEYTAYSNAILIFLPGIAEIKRLNDMLVGHRTFVHGWYIYPLHSTIATEEQERAFLVPPSGYRKIVLATNIAETGITIPDVTCVIDTGKHKEMRFDERRQLSRLIEAFISRANAKQRRGRAGRVQKGLCFHLFTKERHDKVMAEEQTPEMLRLSLQDLVLRVKICKLGGIEQTLSEALDPPSTRNIRRAIDSLVDVRALTNAEDLTPLGRQLARLPLDVFLGKLILLGTIFGCLDAMLTIASILSSKSPFSAPMGMRSQADVARLAFRKGDSDLLTVYNAYCAWRRICTSTAGMSEHQFCRKNFMSLQTLSNIEDLKAQLTTAVVDAGFMKLDELEKASLNRVRFYSRKRNFVEIPSRYNANNGNDLVLNSVIAWSFYPKLLKREGNGWRNVANNQAVSLHPTSVNKGIERPPQWLSFYHIMQSSNKYYNAHETSPVEQFALALVCGEAEFKLYSGVMVIDGNRIRLSFDEWKTMIVVKTLRTQIRRMMAQSFRSPGRIVPSNQLAWLAIWEKIYEHASKKS
ncbi:hypothetical protein P7C71_g4585, partial [Lecanoromycetidae sp. Uapishka_2]